jgi:ABC-type maltose transport system permease subunit
LDAWAKLAAPAILMSLLVALIFLAQHKYLVDRLLVGPVED